MQEFGFQIEKKLGNGKLGRAGVIHTPHGDIATPAFIVVGTKATVKSLSPEQVTALGAQAVLANTYHLYLEPGAKIVREHGGFAKMMGWEGPTFTDSGGFQVFSLGAALGHGVSKIATSEEISAHEASESRIAKEDKNESPHEKLARIDDDGVTFKSVIDGSEHRFTPEISMQIQHDLGADIFFAFDECTSPLAPVSYLRTALDRTHAWASRSLTEHKRLTAIESAILDEVRGDKEGILQRNSTPIATGFPSAGNEEICQNRKFYQQALFGVVQGGAHEDLRRESARTLGTMDFDGYGIGGSFTKDDISTAVRWVNEELPEDKPRHLLGIGEPIDLFLGIENGVDTFDCVAPTRIARNGALYTIDGRINIFNAKYRSDMSAVCEDEACYAHQFTKSYLSHLFRADEMFAATIASIHNLHFVVNLVKKIRQSILEDNFEEFKTQTLARYYHTSS